MSFFRRKNQAATEEYSSWMSDVTEPAPAPDPGADAVASAKPSGSRTSADHLAAAKGAIHDAKTRRESATTGS